MIKSKKIPPKASILGIILVFLLTFYSVSAAAPYAEDLSLTAHSGGVRCDYNLIDTETTTGPTAATAWYKDGEPLMILYLPFEGGVTASLKDYSGTGNDDVTKGGSPTWKLIGSHDGSGAYDFDGNDYLNAGNIFPVNSSYTKTAWIWRTGSTYNNIISGYTHANNNHHFKVDPGGTLNAGHRFGTAHVSDPNTLSNNIWYFVAVTFDYETGLMTLYKNGEAVDNAIVPEDYQDVTDDGVLIGAMNYDYEWQGKIDDARIYDEVLSSEQIRFMYEYGQNAIAPTEVGDGEEWQAAVTPFSSTAAGETVISDTFTIGDDDSDGVPNDIDNCPNTSNPDQEDFDEDGIGDACDDDVDGDGVLNDVDNCPYFNSEDQTDLDGDGIGDACDECIDVDQDGVCANEDNCEGTFNPGQEDADGDGIGDLCDDCLDVDDDGVCDNADNCPGINNPDQNDLDEDGIGDACDDDMDGDDVLNDVDNCLDTYNPEQTDIDSDGIGDLCDDCIDVDLDEVCDDVDNCPTYNPEQSDLDGDGIGDVCDDDVDGDDVPDDMEVGPDSENPDPNYDGNNDGTADRLQSNVVSGFTYNDAYYVTLAVTAPAGATLTYVEALAPPAELPDGTEFPYGVFAFTIENVAVGGPATVTLHLPDGESPNTYYKYGFTQDDQTDHWYEFMYDETTETGAEINENVITLHFVDGERGDDDLQADGVIMDDGAPALSDTTGEEDPDVPAVGGGGGGGGCFISTGTSGSHAAVQGMFMLLLVSVLVPLVRFERKRENK